MIDASKSNCKTCCDGEYYPYYGLAPHLHGSAIGQTKFKDELPSNFTPDTENNNAGIYCCPDCDPDNKEA